MTINLTDNNDISNNNRLRTTIKPPDYLGAPVQSNLEGLRAEAKIDHLSVILTIEVGVQVFQKSFFVRTSMLWNRLPLALRVIACPNSFKTGLTNHLWSTTDHIERFCLSNEDNVE